MQRANSEFFKGLRQSDIPTDPKTEIATIIEGMLSLLTESSSERSIPYRPKLKAYFGSTNAAILLQQIWFHFKNKKYQPFYKFLEPCGHELYREGDSWFEELEFSAEEISGALKKISIRINAGTPKSEAYKNGIVIRWVDKKHVTWYDMNLLNFAGLIAMLYKDAKPDLSVYITKLENMVYQINDDSWFSIETGNHGLYSSTESPTENTTDTVEPDVPLRLNPEPIQEQDIPDEEADSDEDEAQNNIPPQRTFTPAPKPEPKKKKERSSLGSKKKTIQTRDSDDDDEVGNYRRSAAPVRRLTAPIPQQPYGNPSNAPTRQNGANSPLEAYIAGIAGFEITAPVAELLRQPMANGDVPIKLFDEHAPYAKWVKQVAEAYETASSEKNFKMRTDTLATRISNWDKFSEWASENDEVKVDNRPKRSSVKDQLDWLLKYNRLSQEEYDESVGKLHEFPE